jgi:NAD(P)-dependent dehydrogenase (short-subunit alcohol dehydrogenase family)
MKGMLTMNQPIALITGASSGIGKASAEALANKGYHIYAGVRRPAAATALRSANVTPVQLDVTDDASITAAIAEIINQSGRIDLLINNAGYGQYGILEEVSAEEAQRQFDVNVFGLMRVTRAVLPIMRAQKSGRIINMSSVAGRVSTPLGGWYSASKHAVEALSDALRLEMAPFGIKVVVIQPGAIKTSFDDVALNELTRTARIEAYRPMAQAFKRLVEGSYARAPGPELGAKAIVRAATDRRPPLRIVLPNDSRALIALKRLFGDGFLDWAVSTQLR